MSIGVNIDPEVAKEVTENIKHATKNPWLFPVVVLIGLCAALALGGFMGWQYYEAKLDKQQTRYDIILSHKDSLILDGYMDRSRLHNRLEQKTDSIHMYQQRENLLTEKLLNTLK